MPIIIESNILLLLAFFFLAVFAAVSWWRSDIGAVAVIFCSPLYILKIKNLPLNFLDLLILVFIAVWLIKKIREKKVWTFFEKIKGIFGVNFLFSIFLIVSGVFLSAVFSENLKIGLGILKSWFLEPIIFSFILVDICEKEKDFKRVAKALFFSGVVVAIVSLTYTVFSNFTFDGRLKAFYLSPNYLAMYLVPAFLMIIGICDKNARRSKKALQAFGAFLMLVSLYFTKSYAAWISLFTAFIFVLFLVRKEKKFNFKIVATLLIFIFTFFCWQAGSEKALNLFSDRSSLQSRIMIWRSAGKILQDNWILGIGPGLFQDYYLDYQKYFSVPYLEWAVPQPHNLFLAFWLEAGFLGFIGFLWLVILFFKKTLIVFHKSKQPIILSFMAVLIYVLVHGLVDTPVWKNDLALVFWAVIFLGYKAGRLCDSQKTNNLL